MIMNDAERKAYSILKADFAEAKKAKSSINGLIAKWTEAYEGTSSKHKANRSNIVLKEIAKQIEWLKPNATEPFLSTSSPIRIPMAGGDVQKSKAENYLNLKFTGNFNRSAFINKLVLTSLIEGTAWVKDGWKSKTTVKKKKSLSMEEILQSGLKPTKLQQNNEGTFDAVYEQLTTNRPDSRVLLNEHCYPDPSAKMTEDMSFFCEEVFRSISDLNSQGTIDAESINLLKRSMASSNSGKNSLEASKEGKGASYGYSSTFKTDANRQKIRLIEYWGFYDLDGDGIAEPVFAIWADKEDVLLYIGANPMPRQNIPFHNVVYSEKIDSLWGNSLAYFLMDNQVIKTQIIRGILDNMAAANNGQKFIKHGSLSYTEKQKMMNGDRVIYTIKDPSEMMKDGSYNSLPGSIFSMISLVNKEIEDLSGTSTGGPSLAQDSLDKGNSGNLTLTMAQQRMAAYVRDLSSLIEESMKNWLSSSEAFLENDQIAELFTEDEIVDYQIFEGAEELDISLKVGTSINKMAILQQLNMLLQQSKQLGESVPPETFNYLVAEMFELFDMYKKAEELREFKPEPSPQQQQQQEMEMQAQSLGLEKLQAEIQEIMTNMQKAGRDSQQAALTAQSNARYKAAQEDEKRAKAESHRINSVIKPAEFSLMAQELATKMQENKEVQW